MLRETTKARIISIENKNEGSYEKSYPYITRNKNTEKMFRINCFSNCEDINTHKNKTTQSRKVISKNNCENSENFENIKKNPKLKMCSKTNIYDSEKKNQMKINSIYKLNSIRKLKSVPKTLRNCDLENKLNKMTVNFDNLSTIPNRPQNIYKWIGVLVFPKDRCDVVLPIEIHEITADGFLKNMIPNVSISIKKAIRESHLRKYLFNLNMSHKRTTSIGVVKVKTDNVSKITDFLSLSDSYHSAQCVGWSDRLEKGERFEFHFIFPQSELVSYLLKCSKNARIGQSMSLPTELEKYELLLVVVHPINFISNNHLVEEENEPHVINNNLTRHHLTKYDTISQSNNLKDIISDNSFSSERKYKYVQRDSTTIIPNLPVIDLRLLNSLTDFLFGTSVLK